MQQALRQFAAIALPGDAATALALKVAVASGPARRFVVGDPAIQLLDTLAEEWLARMAAGEHLAAQREVLVDKPTAVALANVLQVAEWRVDHITADRFAVINAVNTGHAALQSVLIPAIVPDSQFAL